MKKRLKEMVPRLIVAQTLMLAAITGLTIGGDFLSKDSYACKVIGQTRMICIKR